MDDIDTNELRKLAEAATPGPWQTIRERVVEDDSFGTIVTTCTKDDARFIAAANPTTILALLDRLDETERRLEAVCNAATIKGAGRSVVRDRTLEEQLAESVQNAASLAQDVMRLGRDLAATTAQRDGLISLATLLGASEGQLARVVQDRIVVRETQDEIGSLEARDTIESLRTDLAAMTERAEKAERGLRILRECTVAERDRIYGDAMAKLRAELARRTVERDSHCEHANQESSRASDYAESNESLRTALANAEATIARIASAVFEPVALPDGCPPLVDRIIGAIEQLAQERTDARSGEHIAIEHATKLEADIARLRNPPAAELEETLEVPAWVAESIVRARGTSSRAADARPGLYFDSVVGWLAEDREKLLATVKRFISSERVMAARYHDAQATIAKLREAMVDFAYSERTAAHEDTVEGRYTAFTRAEYEREDFVLARLDAARAKGGV